MPFTLHLPSKNSLNVHNYRNVFSSEISTCSSLRKHCYTNASQIFPNPYFCVLSEVRKRKINIIYWCIYIESRKMVLMNRFPGQAEKCRRRAWTCGYRGRRGWGKWESSIGTHTTMCEVAASGEAGVQHRELSSVPCDDLERWDAGVGEEAWEGGNICVHIADSCCCTAETNTIL